MSGRDPKLVHQRTLFRRVYLLKLYPLKISAALARVALPPRAPAKI